MTPADLTVAHILRREGGLSNHPKDRGGLTHWGITAPFLARVWGRAVVDTDLHHLTEAQASLVYLKWLTITKLDQIADPRLMEVVADFAVHSGEGIAIKALQRAANVPIDGILGPATLDAVNHGDPDVLERKVWAARLRLWSDLCRRDPDQLVFLRGWVNRAAAMLQGES